MQTKASIRAIDLRLMVVLRYVRGLLPLILGSGICRRSVRQNRLIFRDRANGLTASRLERSGKLWPAFAETVTTFLSASHWRARSASCSAS